MIDTKLFTVDKILAAFLHDSHGNVDAWRKFAEIIPEYETRPVDERFPPKCVVKFKKSFLRYSKGPRQGYFWDMYGDDFLTPELAFMALIKAPVPPFALKTDRDLENV